MQKLSERLLFLLIALLFISSCDENKASRYEDWKVYGGSEENIKYSTLTQVDTTNVHTLQVAWQYRTGDADTVKNSQIQCNPVIVDGVLYAASPRLRLFALDAATGKEKWVFDPQDSVQNKRWHSPVVNISRGVSYWEEGEDKRILFTAGAIIYAINATDGTLITGFGEEGGVDLHNDLGREDAADLYIAPTSPGMVFKDLFIIGGRVSEAQYAAPGHVRAYNIKTGKLEWIFRTIPHPGEFGYDTWKDTAAYRFIGGANNWSGFSLDKERGIVFVPTGSAAFDFYGGKRKGDNLFANCLIALDAATGKRIWHYQFVHHDVWDRDVPAPPVLVTLNRNGKQIDAVAQTTKQGYVFVFERATGTPVFPIEEKPVPQTSPLFEEELSPTQPAPSLPEPFSRQKFGEEDINTIVPDSIQQQIKTKLAGYIKDHMFSPPSKEGTVILPGFDGGAEWGGPAFDPETGMLYVNANEMPWILTMVDAAGKTDKKETLYEAGKRVYMGSCMNCHAPDRKGAGNFPGLIDVNKKYNPAEVNELLLTGRRMMPGFKHLLEEEREAVITYVLEQKEKYKQPYTAPAKPINDYLNLPYSFTGYNKFETPEGYPAISPPWGTLNAINLNTGEHVWNIPLGEFPELTARGIPPTGTENYGGPVVTAGGLVFIAATPDGKMRAFDKHNGKLLWEYQLPFAGYATPSVYIIDGKQYIVIACGGGKLNTKSGDAYIAFALP
ncbi:MAG: PQQ-binding-like beta-propeller repeat protein [Chitinophagaceae bacterium]|nr:PQQ-binding-like beta-propeller repeat protein [Chitinophagaceae bacterium]MCW5926415.1 PQQ-binding-like beta-propeller repeat protein [Chitinophagaceae bacterium]